MAPDWAAAARAALAQGPAAMVSVVATEGSAPREAGVRMIVTAEALAGTIGGGALEYQAIGQARAMLDRPPGTWRMQDYPLGPLLGQCCGGRVRLLVERLDPVRSGWLDKVADGRLLVSRLEGAGIERSVAAAGMPEPAMARGPLPGAGAVLVERLEGARAPLLLFGAGHVGRAIARASMGLPLALAWFDGRAAAAVPGVALTPEAEQIACAGTAGTGTAILIMTHDHGLDYRLAAAALRGQAGFVGLIGSATKRARFVGRLVRDGIDPARLTCPIGLPGIAGKAPEVIAIAVLAQLLARA